MVAYLALESDRGLHAMQLVQRWSLNVTMYAARISVIINHWQCFPGEMAERLKIAVVVARCCIDMCSKRVVITFRIGFTLVRTFLVGRVVHRVHLEPMTIAIFWTIILLDCGGSRVND